MIVYTELYTYMSYTSYVMTFSDKQENVVMQPRYESIRGSVDSLCRDGADTPIVRVHR